MKKTMTQFVLRVWERGREVNCPPQSIIETWASGEWELAGQRKLTEALLMKKRVTQNSHEEKDLR